MSLNLLWAIGRALEPPTELARARGLCAGLCLPSLCHSPFLQPSVLWGCCGLRRKESFCSPSWPLGSMRNMPNNWIDSGFHDLSVKGLSKEMGFTASSPGVSSYWLWFSFNRKAHQWLWWHNTVDIKAALSFDTSLRRWVKEDGLFLSYRWLISRWLLTKCITEHWTSPKPGACLSRKVQLPVSRARASAEGFWVFRPFLF